MKQLIYHGSINIIEKPIYGYGNIHNDYGLGFYCTYSLEMAKEWASKNNSKSYVNMYEIDLSKVKVLNLNLKGYNMLHWLALLLNNRVFKIKTPLAISAKEFILKNYLISLKDYDVVIGYRADDSYFSFAQDFINGSISYKQLSYAMKLGKLGEQIVIISKKGFNNLKYLSYVEVDNDVYYPKRILRDKTARNDYLNIEKNKLDLNDIYIMDLLRGDITKDDPRL